MENNNNKRFLLFVCLLGVLGTQQVAAQCDFIDKTNGRRYIGECKTNTINGIMTRIPDGKGKQINPDKSYFVGQFSNGQRIRGQYYWDDGYYVDSAFYENDNLKSGIYNYPNGAKYKGTFKNDEFDGDGIYYYESGRNEIQYKGEFKNGMFNGKGTLHYKDGKTQDGQWKDDIFLGAKIGEYQTQDVLKKGDTIVTSNNKYLLSRQTVSNGKDESYGFLYPYGEFYFVHKTIEEDNKPTTLSDLQTGQSRTFLTKNVIGFVIQESINQYKFHEIKCDTTIYDKLLQFCDWQICRMENTVNISNLSYADYERQINEDAELYAIIASQKAKDIVINLTGDLADFLWDKKLMNELKEGSAVSILGQNITTSTSINDYVRLLTTDAAMYQFGLDELKLGSIKFKDVKDCILQKNIIKVSGGELSLGEFLENSYRTEQTKRIEKELETETAKYFKQGRDIIDNCIPSDLKFKSKQAYLYYAVTKNLPEYGEMLGYMAASIKLTFFNSSYKNELDTHIANCRNKKQFLENYKHEYQTLIEKNKANCLEYSKAINKLKSDVFNSFENPITQEILVQMQEYVFGEKGIPECKVLSFDELKPVGKHTEQKPINKNDDIIGYYENHPVYKKHDSIIVNNNMYSLLYQPKQNSFDNKLIRYFLIYEGSNKKMKFEGSTLTGYNEKKIIGWINYDVLKNTYKFERYTNEQSIPGLNFFGSIYIGDNNPLNANDTPNYDIPAQDEIDNGAKQHDICYDNNSLKGAKGVFGSEGGHCDHDLAALCLKELNLKDIAAFSASSLPKHTSVITGMVDYYAGARHYTLNMLSNEVFKPRNTRDRGMLILELFSVISAKKAITNIIQPNVEPKEQTNHGTDIIIRYDQRTLIITKSNGKEVYAEPGDYFEGEFNNGKIIQGVLYDENGKEKERIIIGRSR